MSLVTVLSIRAQIDSHLTYRCYTTQDGLPQLQTERLWQDSRGSSVFVRADRSTLVNLHNISRLNFKKRTCTFRSSDGRELETSLLVPAFKRLEELMR